MMDEPFRFMDLPKELRLIMYEHLSIKTTHYKLDAEWLGCTELADLREAFENGDNYVSPEGIEVPKDSTILLHRTILGIAILRTSRTLASEAKVILQPKLNALRMSSYRIIANSIALYRWTTEHVIKCLSHGTCGLPNDIRVWLDETHTHFDHDHKCQDTKWNFTERHVQIAVFNDFADSMTADSDKSDDGMWLLDSHCYEDGLQRAMSWHYRRICSTEFPTTSLRITTRMALLSAVERQSYTRQPPFTHVLSYQEESDTPPLYMGTDEPIETEEWEDMWAEGERIFTARELAQ